MLKASKGAPRGMPDYKFWMSHPLHKAKFTEGYEKVSAANPPTENERMALQCKVAQDLFELEPDEVKESIAVENAENRSARFSAFKKLMSGRGFTLEGADEIDAESKKL